MAGPVVAIETSRAARRLRCADAELFLVGSFSIKSAAYGQHTCQSTMVMSWKTLPAAAPLSAG